MLRVFELSTTQAVPAAPIPMVYVSEPVEWEYLQVADEQPLNDERLNALGSEGWELASILDRETQVIFFFKRQVRE